jgi:hypothetical protein
MRKDLIKDTYASDPRWGTLYTHSVIPNTSVQAATARERDTAINKLYCEMCKLYFDHVPVAVAAADRAGSGLKPCGVFLCCARSSRNALRSSNGQKRYVSRTVCVRCDSIVLLRALATRIYGWFDATGDDGERAGADHGGDSL